MLNYNQLASMSDKEFDSLLTSLLEQKQRKPIVLPEIEPEPTGIVKGALKSLGRGVGGAISQYGKFLEYDQNQQPDLVNKAGYYIDEFGNKVSNLIEAPVAEPGSQREKFFQAMESVPGSLAMAAPAFIGGALGGPLGALAGGAASFPIMQQATAQDTYERLSKERPELSEEQKRDLAAKTGLWEAGPEAATNVAEALLFRTTPLGRGALPFVKAFGKNVAKATPLEMAGEAATGYGQATTLQEVFPEVDPLKEAVHGANVAAYMAPFMAGGGTVLQKLTQPKEETQPSKTPVPDDITETDLLNEPYTVSPDASMGTQQELFDKQKKFKYTASPFTEPTEILPSVYEQGVVTLKDDKAGRAQLKQIKEEAKRVGATLDTKRVPAFGGGMAIQVTAIPPISPFDMGVAGQPSLFDEAYPTSGEQLNLGLTGVQERPVLNTTEPLDLLEEGRGQLNLPLSYVNDLNTINIPDTQFGPVPQGQGGVVSGVGANQFVPQRPISISGISPIVGTGATPVLTGTESTELLQDVKKLNLKLRNPKYVKQMPDADIISVLTNPASNYLLDNKARQVLSEEFELRNIQEATGELFQQGPVSKQEQKVYRTRTGKMASTKGSFKLRPGEYITQPDEIQQELPFTNEEQLTLDLGEINAQENQGGLPSTVGEGQAPIQGESFQGTSQEALTAGRDVQTDEVKGQTRVAPEIRKYVQGKYATYLPDGTLLAGPYNKVKMKKVYKELYGIEPVFPDKKELEDYTEEEVKSLPAGEYVPKTNAVLREFLKETKKSDIIEEAKERTKLTPVGKDVTDLKPVELNTIQQKQVDALEAELTRAKINSTWSPKKKESKIKEIKQKLFDITGDVQYAPEEIISDKTTLEKELTELRAKVETASGIDKARIEDRIDELEEQIASFIEKGGKAKGPSKTFSEDTFTQQKNQAFLPILEQNANDPVAILDWIAKNSNRKFHKIIAEYLKGKIDKDLQIVPDNDIDVYGYYNHRFGEENPYIQYNFDLHQKNNEDLVSTILHELVHNALDSKLSSNEGKIYKNRLVQLKKQIRKELRDKGINPDDWYGLRSGVSVEELLTEAFSNKDFIKLLENVQLKEPKADIKTLFDKFVDFVRSVLNIPVKDRSALKEVLSVGVAAIEGTKTASPVKEGPKAKGISYKEELDYAKLKYQAAQTAGDKILSGLGALQGLYPGAHKVIRDFFRNPFWVAKKTKSISENLGNMLMRVIKESENKTATYNIVGRRLTEGLGDVKGLDILSEEFNKLSPEDQSGVERLMVYGDFAKKEFKDISELPADVSYVLNISQKAFETYRDFRKFVNKVLKQFNEEVTTTSLVRYDRKIRKELEKLINEDKSLNEEEVKTRIKQILESADIDDQNLVLDALSTVLSTRQVLGTIKKEIQGVPGYMARVRKPGQYKLNIFATREGKEGESKEVRVYSGLFTSPFERDSFEAAFKKNPEEYLGPNFVKGEEYTFKVEYVPKGVINRDSLGVTVSDLTITDVLDKLATRETLDEKSINKIKKALDQASLETLLGGTASSFKLKRLEDYIAGFETNPVIALQTHVNNMARSIAKSRYMAAQLNNLKDIHEKNKELYEYAFHYVRSTTTQITELDKVSSKTRYIATTYFLAANVSASLINLLQNFIVGNSTLAKHTSFANANKLLAKYMKELIPQNIKHATADQERRHIAPPPEGLSSQLKRALLQYRESGLNFDTQSALAAGINEDLSGGAIWKNFKTVMDKLMIPFKTVEVANREAALLAAFEVFAKNDGLDLSKEIDQTKFDSLYDKSVEFVNEVHFMGQGNLPVGIQKNAIARAVLALQSFGINFWNMLWTNATSKDKRDRMVAVRILGMLFATGGFVGAFPAADDVNKLLKRLLGFDPKLEARKALGEMTTEEFAEFLMYGAPTLLGVNIANNVNIRIPVISNIIGGSDLGVSSTGAVGSLLARQWKALNYASDGEFVKALGIGTPEGFARAFRAYDESTRGFTTQKGAPVYFEGKPLKLETTEALVKGALGFRSTKEANVAEARFSKYELQQMWQNKRSVAVNKFARGDRQAMLDFNEALRDNDQARALVKPITGADRLKALTRKEPKRDVTFEREYA